MLTKLIKKYYVLIGAILTSLLFLAYYSTVYSTKYDRSIGEFKRSFEEREDLLKREIGFFQTKLQNGEIRDQWQSLEPASGINLHVYRRDSLIFWNTNQLPIIRFAEIHFPAEGLLHLQNGWYYAKMAEEGEYTICASFLIKQDYSYENKELINDFSPELHLPYSCAVSLDQEKGYPVFSKQGEFVFSLLPDENQVVSRVQSVGMLALLLTGLIFWFFWLIDLRKRTKRRWKWVFPVVIIGLRWASLHFEWFSFLKDSEVSDPMLYGVNEWLPNFLEYLLNIVVLVYLINELRNGVHIVRKSRFGQWLILGVYILSISFWILLLYLSSGLIEDSSIPLVIDQLFSLNVYSVLAITSLGVYFYAYYLLVRKVTSECIKRDWKPSVLAVITFIMGCSILFYAINNGEQSFMVGIFPMAFYGSMLYFAFRFPEMRRLGAGLILLILFSLATASNMGDANVRKERGERELYANQLATEKNIVTEAEYALMSEKLKSDNFLKKFISSPQSMSVSDFQEGMERRLFHGFWERYEMNFSLFDQERKPLIEYRKDPNALYNELQDIIERSGVPSEIDTNIFFIEDYSGQYSYIIRQPLLSKDSSRWATLFCTLKSKQIPEEIGFPRLLISTEANVLETLENYSIVRYHNGKLITKYGGFNYPSSPYAMIPVDMGSKGFFDFGGFNHYMLKKTDADVVVLSKRNYTSVDLVTSFSYLFSFYGLLLLPLLFRLNAGGSATRRTLSLAMKIQLVLISLVFLSLLAFGWGSGIFVSNQYNQYTNDVIREKLNSVQTEVRAKLGNYDELSIEDNGNYMQYILQKFAKVFFTDINLYDNDGYLLATSRPKVFNIGLLSEQMNPTAYKYMRFRQKSEFVHNESIGELNYSSAYLPFYNNKGDKLGFINLQHFGQQREFENQIQKFLVAIINVFILLLAISIVLAIFISTWLTSPLRILQESFAAVRFGKHNEQISYDKEDEIGALVKDYNQKLLELEFAAQQLAKSERESAWREMAKQVAHEIKNPLTPMKLSVQQLLRTYNPDDPKSSEKLQRVANSIIEQIDALTKIANEFSSFAKMPNPSEQRIELVALIESVKEVFSSQGKALITIQSNTEEVYVMADKDQFVRVFNNLIKNANQAISSDRTGKIEIRLQTYDNRVKIFIRDNGVGIEPSKVGKIFVPYFTTKSTGTGLGLAMVKQIIENHKGTIDFESEVGVGTTFEIDLPVEK